MGTTRQKQLLEIYNYVASELNLPQQTTVYTSADTQVQQVLAFIYACQDDLTDKFDWNCLQVQYSFETVINQQAYAFPADYNRVIQGTIFDATNRWPITITTPTQWRVLNIWNLAASPFEYLRVIDDEMLFFPIPGAVYNFVLDYISNYNVINGTTGDTQAQFTQDSDLSIFDYRLVVYMTKMKFLAAKGMDTTAALAEFNNAYALTTGRDIPPSKMTFVQVGPKLISTANIPDGSWPTSN